MAQTKAKTFDDVPLDTVLAREKKAIELIAQLAALYPELTTLSEEDRRHSLGRYREGETEALRSVIKAIESDVSDFKSLADADEGHDPNTVETGLISARLDKRDSLARVATRIARFSQSVADTELEMGELSRLFLLAAYRIARGVARTDKKVRAIIAPALSFYSKTRTG
jgi:hypothetical protein